jgi:fumarylacetoacetase
MTTWLEIPENSHFTIHNIPFGVAKFPNGSSGLCSRIGDYIIDLAACARLAYFTGIEVPDHVFEQTSLNKFISLGKNITNQVRNRLQSMFGTDQEDWCKNTQGLWEYLHYKVDEVTMLMPLEIGDYTDFYSSIEHARNVGTMFRDPENALLPNWKHLPVGYHGRSSSIVISGTEIKRPKGQYLPQGSTVPEFGFSKLMDFELEMAFVVGKPNSMGESISTAEAEEYLFGMLIFNDWSARDIQSWEYVPLGPFLGKNFASSVSPWVVTMEALEPFRVQGPQQDVQVLPYLETQGPKGFDIDLEVILTPENGVMSTICHSNFKYLYWNMAQQLAHHTIGGCPMRVGDLCASGTISGPTPESYGSMLELSWKGTKPILLSDGTERKFIQNGDTITMTAVCEKGDIRVGFGEVTGKLIG